MTKVKSFVEDAGNGYKWLRSADDIAINVDQNAGVRLALIMHENGLLSDEDFLRVIDTSYKFRVKGEFDEDAE